MSTSYPSAQPKSQVSTISPASFLTWLTGGVVLLNLFVFTLAGLSLRQSYHNYQEQAEITTQNLTRVLESEIAGDIKTDDVALLAMIDDYKKQRAASGVDRKVLNADIEGVRSRLPEIDALRIVDAQGLLVYGTDVIPGEETSLADRPHFVRLRDDPKAGLVIAKPQVSRANQKWVIVLARRVDQMDGSFGGMAFAAITLEHFAKTFPAINVGPRGVVALLDSELDIIVRHPEPQKIGSVIGQKVATPSLQAMVQSGRDSGAYQASSAVDGIKRIFSYRRVDGYPLVVVVGLATEDYLAEWRNEATKLAALAALFALITVTAAWLIYRIWKRQFNSVEALARQEAKFHAVADLTFDWEYWKGPKEEILYMTPSCERVTGYTQAEFVADSGLLLRVIHPQDRHLMDQHLHDIAHQSYQDGTPVDFRIVRRDGDIRWISHNCRSIIGRNGESMGCRVGNRDITLRKQAEEKLQLAVNVFTHASEGIMITTADGTIIDVNDAFTRTTGYSRDEALGRNPRLLNSGRQGKEFYAAMWHDLVENGYWYGEVWNRRKNGEVYVEMLTISAVRDAEDITQQYVALFSDITPLKEHQKQLEHITHYDALTTLPNRILLVDRLHQAMAQAQRREQRLVVVYLDLDGFKVINDRHGHDVGDQLLIALATRMTQALRKGDTLARLGGDEFVVVLVDLAYVAASVPTITRLLAAAAEPVHVGDIVLQVSASLGVTFYPQAEDVDADQLLRQADQAMYQAKLAGKNRYHVFDAEQDRSVRSHHESLERIRSALAAREFVLYYQPKVNMRTGAVIGAEALIRWQHPEKGLLPPAAFLPVIEDHPLAVELGEWVIDTALIQMELWRAAGLDIPVSVNVSAHQLQQGDFVERLREILAIHPNVRPGDLEMEVLETSALDDLARVSQIIEDCRKIGVMFALDDFGTGYSSLTYLKRLPVGQLKIDQSFVRDMLGDPDDLAILDGVIGLAAAFRRQVIAEGVETLEHGEMLLRLGCELAQGYGIARPMPAQEMPGWSAAWRPNPTWADLPSVSREDLPLLFASVEHHAWIAAIENRLRGERENPPQLDYHQCRFGKWLDVEGMARYGAQPALQAIDQLHLQVHALAVDLLELQAQGRNPEALARLGELHRLRDTLLEQLKTLVQENRP